MNIPKGNYKTDWFLADMTNIDKQMFEILTEFGNNTNAFRMKELWGYLFAFYYLSGSRRTEPFLLSPTIYKFKVKQNTYYSIRKCNLKHMEGTKRIHRQIIDQTFMVFNLYEQALFNFLLRDNPIEITIDFKPLLDVYYKKADKLSKLSIDYNGRDKEQDSLMAGISTRFSQLFKANIIGEGSEKPIYSGLSPHMCRHIRLYDMRIAHHLPDYQCQRIFGWDDAKMVSYYSDVRRSMGRQEDIEVYESLKKEYSEDKDDPI